MRLGLAAAAILFASGSGCTFLFDSESTGAGSSHQCGRYVVNLSFDDDNIAPLIGEGAQVVNGALVLPEQVKLTTPELGRRLESATRGEVVVTAEVANPGNVRLLLRTDNDRVIGGFGIENGLLVGYAGSATDTIGSFDAETDSTVRFRVVAEQLFVDTGPDFARLEQRFETTLQPWGAGERVFVEIESFEGNNRFDSLRIQEAPVEDWCNASLLVDDFSDGTPEPLWFTSSDGAEPVEEGPLRVTVGVSNTVLYRSDSRYSLLETPLELEIGALDAQVSVEYYVRSQALDTSSIGLKFAAGLVCVFKNTSCEQDTQVFVPPGAVTLRLHTEDTIGVGPTLHCTVTDSVGMKTTMQCAEMTSNRSLDVSFAVVGSAAVPGSASATIRRIGPPE